MILINEINKETYDNFLIDYKLKHFLATSATSLRRSVEGYKTTFIGFFNQKELIGVAALSGNKVFLNRKKYEITMGPLLDYNNLETTKASLKALANYIAEIKAISCEISPNIIANIHYPEFKELIHKEQYINAFMESDWTYQLESDEDASKQRWFFKKDISNYKSFEDLAMTYEAETKRLIKNAKSFPLKVVELDKENLERAVSILDLTGKRRGFSTRNMLYHQSLYDYMNKNHEAKYLVVELNVEEYLSLLEIEANDLKAAIVVDKDNKSKRARNRVNQNQDQLKAREERISQLKEINSPTVDICSGVFIGANDTMTYLFGGSKKEYMRYYGTYFLQDYTIKYAYDQDYKLYDFYGTLSKFAGFDEAEGIFNFKKGFGGKLYENLGFFEYKPKSIINSTYETLRKIKHLILK